jgi:hypothetical protein
LLQYRTLRNEFLSTIDPRVTATFALKGSIYRFDPGVGAPIVLVKQSDGLGTDWSPIASGASVNVPIDQMIFVAKNGNDATANGTLTAPFLTVEAAMVFITDASTTKKYVIYVFPGVYTIAALTFKPDITVLGVDILNVTINITAFTFHADWTLNTSKSGGFENMFLNFGGNVTQAFGDNSLFFLRSALVNNLAPAIVMTFTGVNGCEFSAIGGIISNTVHLEGMASNLLGPFVAVLEVVGTATSISITAINAAIGSLDVDGSTGMVATNLLSTPAISLVLSGAGSVTLASSDSIPFVGNVAVLAGATLSRLNDAFGVGYTPTTLADWSGTSPETVQSALDRIAAFLGPIP